MGDTARACALIAAVYLMAHAVHNPGVQWIAAGVNGLFVAFAMSRGAD